MKKVLIIVLIICFFLILVIFLKERKLTIIESVIKNTCFIIEEIIDQPINYIDKNIKQFKEKNNIYQKYKKEVKLNKKLKLENDKYNETLRELNNLKENLNLKNSLIDYKIIDSYVINRDIGTFYKQVIIDKGKKDGIKIGMTVINSSGLIGKITKITNNTSTVKLITSSNYKIGVDINNQYGLITEYSDGYFIVEGINNDINIGDTVSTLGTNDIPKGIKIGYIKKSITDKFNLTKKIYVKSSVNFDKLDYVMVIK